MKTIVGIFLSGIYMAAFGASGLFFLKFWLRTADRFFLYFACACWLFASERVGLLFFTADGDEPRSIVYLIRLAAFILIIVAIVNKNRHREGT